MRFIKKNSGDAYSVLHTTCDPVVQKKRNQDLFIGAEHFSSGVGDVSGVIEALLYLLSIVEATRKENSHKPPAAKFEDWRYMGFCGRRYLHR